MAHMAILMILECFLNMTQHTNFLFYKLHHGGLINRLMSFEIALGLSHCSKKKLVLYNVCGNTDRPLDDPSSRDGINLGKRGSIVNKKIPELFDFIDYPKHLVDEMIDFKQIDCFRENEVVITGKSLHDRYFKVSPGDDELDFAVGRPELLLLDDADYHIKSYTLAHYSHFFFNRTKELDRVLDSIKIKQEYVYFARIVANYIGDFNGIHLRSNDHKQNFEVFEKDLNAAITKLSNKKIVLLTDEVDNPIIKDKDLVLLDDIIVDNFSHEFLKLPNTSETAYGLVCALIMTYAQEFIGTLASTYSGYIHRERNKVKKSKFLYLGIDEMLPGHPYSWNGKAYAGFGGMSREWPESRLNL